MAERETVYFLEIKCYQIQELDEEHLEGPQVVAVQALDKVVG